MSRVVLKLSGEAIDYLIEKGYSPDFGARPLRRLIEREIEDPLSEEILRGGFPEAKAVAIRVKDGHLVFHAEGTKKPAEEPEKAQAGT